MLVRLDAAFEALLGVTLLVGAATGTLDGSDFPPPVGTAVLIAVGLVLVVLGALIWSGHVPLKALVFGNAVSTLVGIASLVAVDGFSTLGTVVVAVTVFGLAVLAAAQAATLRA